MPFTTADSLSTLQQAAAAASDGAATRVAPITAALAAIPLIAHACAEHWPDTSDAEAQVQRAVEQLESTFHNKAKMRLPNREAVGGIIPHTQWLALAAELTRVVAGTPTFFGRGAVRNMQRAVTSVRNDCHQALCGIAVQAHAEMLSLGLGAASAQANRHDNGHPVSPLLGRDPLTDPAQVARIAKGLGPLVFTVALARCHGYDVVTSSPNGHEQHHLPVTSDWAPVSVQLDHDGGFITDDVHLIESAVHQVLATLPPNNVQIRVVDPVQLGRNAEYLHRLGDQAAAVIGNKAATTGAELVDLLNELEGHITYVTQKYLQGEYDSLSHYNEQAGEVAEPYRVVLLYDLLAAVSRANNYLDDETIARLTKVAKAGRRCGVFLFVHQNAPFPEPLQNSLSSLPTFTAGTANPAWLLQRLGVEGAAERTFDGPVSLVRAQFTISPIKAIERTVSDAVIHAAARDITTADTIKVLPDDLARSIVRKAAKEATRSGTDWAFANPADPSSWWRRSSADDLRAPFGRAGAQDVAELVFASDTRSNALVAGVPGSGKSIWLHAVIMSLALNYSPDELHFYLVDFKEGVEFNQYATESLRQARVVAIESDRDFGISVLENLDREIERRGELFKRVGGNDTNLASYRASTGEVIPRVLLVMDEFQKLFERDDRTGTRAGELLDRIIRQGRAFGVHVLMASQTLSGNDGLRRHTLDQVPIRVALKSSADDSRRILSEDNPDAALLNRPGEGILNTQGGRRDANQRFQTVLWESDARQSLLRQMHKQLTADGRGVDPWVFNGADRVPNDGLERLRTEASTSRRLNLPFGMPFLIGQEATVRLGREPGANAMLVGDGVWHEALTLATFATRDGVDVRFWLSGGEDDDIHDAVAVFERNDVPVVRRRMIPRALSELADDVSARAQAQDYTARAVLVVVPAAHRLRDLDADDYANELAGPLSTILSEGPDVGVHLVMGFDKWSSVVRRLTSSQQRDLGVRVTGRLTRDDSLRMIDSDAATELRPHQLLLDDPDHNLSLRVQRIVALTPDRIAQVIDARQNSSNPDVGENR